MCLVGGQRPLHLAARRGSATLCKLLLEAGADPSLTDLNGDTAWQMALLYSEPCPLLLQDVCTNSFSSFEHTQLFCSFLIEFARVVLSVSPLLLLFGGQITWSWRRCLLQN